MKKMGIFMAVLIALLIGCKATLQQDPAPLPTGITVQQARLEFQGCGLDGNDVGTTICTPGHPISIVTEFPGTVTFLATGACRVRIG